ncbi:kinase-like domain-containing protein [Xylariaceae sp. FL1651]|nr:kinase-like domain-containing protein [Xylariaceae sp. FL1651]
MDFCAPLDLPYYAPINSLPGPLPTFGEIVDSTRVLGTNVFRRTVRVGKHYVAKFGTGVKALEGQNMLFVKQQTNIRIPDIYAIYTLGEGDAAVTVIIMEFIPGEPLDNIFYRLKDEEKHSLRKMLREQIDELRRIEPMAEDCIYYGSLATLPFSERVWDHSVGPFTDASAMVEAYFDHIFGRRHSQPFIDLKAEYLKAFGAADPRNLQPVFSHADLCPRNIIVQPDGSPCLIDWELSAWYPAFYEYFNSRPLNSELDFLEKFVQLEQVHERIRETWLEAE